jgi:hypothetical protein
MLMFLYKRDYLSEKLWRQYNELVEAGFEYVCEIDGVRLFRKGK